MAALIKIEKGEAVGSGMDKGAKALSEEERRKSLAHAQTNATMSHTTNDGDVDPDRDIGQIGSNYEAEEFVPEWAKKAKKYARLAHS